MRSDVIEGLVPEDGFTQSRLFQAIYQHRREHVSGDEDLTWAQLREEVRELKSHLRFPLTIYRGIFIDIDTEDMSLIAAGIDFNRVGTSWTWNPRAAVVGGMLGGGSGDYEEPNIVLEAKIQSRQCDLLVTMYQNLTVFQEEQEVRLFANIPITVTGVSPMGHGLRLPIRANTGPAADSRIGVLQDMKNALRKEGEPYIFVR